MSFFVVAAGPSWVEVELGPAAPLFTGGIVVPGEEKGPMNQSSKLDELVLDIKKW